MGHERSISGSRAQLVSLIGYRGSGKTTVAKLLAERLGWGWKDADDEIESRAGASIKDIFARGGEGAFRDWELSVVRDLTQLEQTVLALGGGAVLRRENREAMRRGWVIWLTADVGTILSRVATDPTTSARRPNLTAAGGQGEIERLLEMREPLYRECADGVVETVGKRPDQVADEIVCFLGTYWSSLLPDTRGGSPPS